MNGYIEVNRNDGEIHINNNEGEVYIDGEPIGNSSGDPLIYTNSTKTDVSNFIQVYISNGSLYIATE